MQFRRAIMRNLAFLCVLLAACQSGPQSGVTSVPGRGAISIEVVPNPIVARQISGNTYEFPFEVVVRETGGRPVEVTGVTVTVFGPGNISVGRESWDAARIRSLGYSTSINARGEIRYRFTPQKEVPDERLFGSVSAELRVDARDDTGATTNATTVVTVRR